MEGEVIRIVAWWLALTMGDGPLDEVSTGATHEPLVNAVKAKDAKVKAGAQKNRPKL
jgi:hypothetical protein